MSDFRFWLVNRVGVPSNWTIEDTIMHLMQRPPGSWTDLSPTDDASANERLFTLFEEFVAEGAPDLRSPRSR